MLKTYVNVTRLQIVSHKPTNGTDAHATNACENRGCVEIEFHHLIDIVNT